MLFLLTLPNTTILMKKHLLALCLTALAFTVSVKAAYHEYFDYNGTQRHMIVHAPSGLPESPALLVSLHGMNQDAAYQQNQCNWESVADTAKFVVVFPDGIDKSWNLSGRSDIDFILYIMDMMNERYNCDMNRVYLSGFSMGAMMCYYTASVCAEKFAAIAPVSGYMMDQSARSTCEIPVFHTHGTADDVCVYDPVPSYIEKWVNINKCNKTPEVYNPYPADKPQGNCTLKIWSDGTNGVEVALLTLPGKGHWHSMDTNGALTSKEIWNFVKNFSRGPAAAAPPKIVEAFPDTAMFDLPDSNLVLRYVFSEGIKVSALKATLSNLSKSYTLKADQTEEYDSILTFTVPYVLVHGEYSMTMENMVGRRGGKIRKRSWDCQVGLEDFDPYATTTEIYAADWQAGLDTYGECIPEGWKRSMKPASGFTKYTSPGTAVTEGSRIMQFSEEGEFSTGMYLCAESYSKVSMQGGVSNDNRIHLTPGAYQLEFKSASWNSGGSFDVSVSATAMSSVQVLEKTGLTSTGSAGGKGGGIITGSRQHSFAFDAPVESDYIFTFSTSDATGTGTVIGDFCIMRGVTKSQQYRGAYLRALDEFKTLLAAFQNSRFDESQELRSSMARTLENCDGYMGYTASGYSEITSTLTAANKRMNTRMTNVTQLDSLWTLANLLLDTYRNTPLASKSNYAKLEKAVTRNQSVSRTDDTRMSTVSGVILRAIQAFQSDIKTSVPAASVTITETEYISLDGREYLSPERQGLLIEVRHMSDGTVTRTLKRF